MPASWTWLLPPSGTTSAAGLGAVVFDQQPGRRSGGRCGLARHHGAVGPSFIQEGMQILQVPDMPPHPYVTSNRR
jgi:hypothetical protein